jgi:predicted nucleic acid-binding protein
VVSELIRKKPLAAVVEWVDAQDEEHCFLSVLTLGELRKGIDLLPDGRKKSRLQNWLEQDLQERFEGRILGVDAETAERWGADCSKAQRTGRHIPVMDGLIAATAAVHGLVVVTRNVKDMEPTGIPVLNPWDFANE